MTDIVPNQTFTVDDANSLIEIEVSGSLTVGGGIETVASSRLVLDSAGANTIVNLGGGWHGAGAYCNVLGGAGTIQLTGLAAGSHTLRLQASGNAASDKAYCRSHTAAYEYVYITVIERKR
jgi:hypothetical protein